MNDTTAAAHSPALKKRRELDEALLTSSSMPDYILEMFRSLRTKILLAFNEVTDKSLAVTSLEMNAGKSTICSNIAISLAQQDLNTLLIDGDMRRGVLHNCFVLEKSPGLSELLFSDREITNETIAPFLQQTHVPNLRLLTSGNNVPNPTDLLSSQRFKIVKQILSSQFDFIVIDTPPYGAVTDAIAVHTHFSRYLLVARAGKTNIVDMQKKLDEFTPVKEKILGIVLNHARVSRKIKYYRASGY